MVKVGGSLIEEDLGLELDLVELLVGVVLLDFFLLLLLIHFVETQFLNRHGLL